MGEVNHNDKSLIMKDELKIPIENQSSLNQNDIVSENEISTSKQIEPVTKPPDGGVRAWVIMISSFLCNGIIFGLINSYGAIYVALKNQYDQEKSESSETKASFIGSLLVGSTFILSPVSGVLVDRFGIRKTAFIGGLIATTGVFISSFSVNNFGGLCFTFSIMLGAGSSLVYTPSVAILGHYFSKRIGIVNGFVTTGSSIFAVGLPHLLKVLFAEIGISGTFRVLSCFTSILMLASLTFKPTFDVSQQTKKKETNDEDSECCSKIVNIENWKNRKYVIWTIAAPIALLGYFVPYVHIVAYVEDILPGESGEALLTSIAITAGIGKIIFGLIADRPNINPICLQQFSFVFIGCCTMLLTTARFFGSYSYASLIVFALVMGLFDGCFSTMLGPIAVYICGPVGASQAIGFILGLCAGPLMLGPLIAGILYKHFGSYVIPFICAGCPPIIGAVIMCAMYFPRNKKEYIGCDEML